MWWPNSFTTTGQKTMMWETINTCIINRVWPQPIGNNATCRVSFFKLWAARDLSALMGTNAWAYYLQMRPNHLYIDILKYVIIACSPQKCSKNHVPYMDCCKVHQFLFAGVDHPICHPLSLFFYIYIYIYYNAIYRQHLCIRLLHSPSFAAIHRQVARCRVSMVISDPPALWRDRPSHFSQSARASSWHPPVARVSLRQEAAWPRVMAKAPRWSFFSQVVTCMFCFLFYCFLSYAAMQPYAK